MAWFNKKTKSQHLEIDLLTKNKYEKDYSINWESDKCHICNFPLKIGPIGPDIPNNEMSYGDFFIRYEHKFLRSIYSKEQLESSPKIKTLKGYYKTFKKFIKICVSLQSVLVSHVNFDDSDDHDHELQDFLRNNCAGYNLEDLRNEIYLLDSNILMRTLSINSTGDYILNSNWK